MCVTGPFEGLASGYYEAQPSVVLPELARESKQQSLIIKPPCLCELAPHLPRARSPPLDGEVVNEGGRCKPRAGDAMGTDPALARSANRWPIPGWEVTGKPSLLPSAFS